MQASLNISVIKDVPDIVPGDRINNIIGDCLEKDIVKLENGDIISIAHKIFSKAEGAIINLRDVVPSQEAENYAKKLNKDPRKVEVILQESSNVIRSFRRENQNEGVMICEHRLGFISANAAVDESNVDGIESVITLPKDPDRSARELKSYIEDRFKVNVGVIITDTFGRPWRIGQVNVCIGLAGVPATIKEQGKIDAWGRELRVTEPAFSDELAAASGLVIQKSSKTPVVLFRGLIWNEEVGVAQNILRKKQEDMFR